LKLNKKLIIKLHPSAAELDISDLVKRIDPRITVIKSGNIFSLIESCEALVVTDVSSVILEAQMFGKPVISLSIKDYRFGEPEVFRSKSCMRATIDGFEDSLNSVLNKPDLRKQIIENGYRFVKKSLSNRGNATEALIEYLKQL
jgi:glycosyltransferase involved in cell wall biosynthesis